jgi:hypothetical protein
MRSWCSVWWKYIRGSIIFFSCLFVEYFFKSIQQRLFLATKTVCIFLFVGENRFAESIMDWATICAFPFLLKDLHFNSYRAL